MEAELNIHEIAQRTAEYSGRDLRELVTTAFSAAVERTLAAGDSAVNAQLSMADVWNVLGV